MTDKINGNEHVIMEIISFHFADLDFSAQIPAEKLRISASYLREPV